MNTVRIIPVSQSLVDAVSSFLPGKGADAAAALVVFPGKRPSHFLRKVLGAKYGKAFIPPRIFSYDEFIQHLAEEHLNLDEPDLDRLDACAMLHEIHTGLAEKLGGSHFAAFDQFLPLGFRLFDELEELQLAGADKKSLQEHVGGLSFGNRHLLPSYFEEFYRRLKAGNRLTRSLRLRAVAESVDAMDLSGYQPIIVSGFYALTPTDRRIFKSLENREQSILLFQEGPALASQIDWLAPNDPSAQRQMDLFGEASPAAGMKNTGPDIRFYRATDTHGQVFALSAQLKELFDRGEKPDERTVIVLPSSDALFPVLYQPLALLKGDDYNVSLGYPISRTPLYGLLSSLMDLLATAGNGNVHANAYIRFVLHPYVKNIRYEKRTDVTRVLFHALEESLARRPATMVSLDDMEEANPVFERIAAGLSGTGSVVSAKRLKEHLKGIHDKTIRPFLKPGTLGEFSSKLIDLILLINEESTAYRHPLFSRYAEKLIEIARTIGHSSASDKKFEQITSLSVFLRNYVGSQSVPFPGTPLRGMQVLGLLETRALSFDRVFMLDVSDDVLPGERESEMLLPQIVREKLGLETYKDRERLLEYYFTNLVQGAREVHLFFTENDKQQRSRFIEKILWERQQKSPESGEAIHLARYAIHLAHTDPAEIPKTKETTGFLANFEFNSTALDVYLKCQLRFYYRYVLGLKEKEEVGEEIEQLDVGNLVHRIMAEFYEPLRGKQLRPGDVDTESMRAVIERVFEQVFGADQKGAVYLLKQQTIAKLAEFVEEYQKRVLQDRSVEIIGLEQEVSGIKNGHHVNGRIDRVERREDGRTYILDYKIRQDDTPYKVSWKKFNPDDRQTWDEAIGSLQLPMYSLLYSEHSGQSLDNVIPAYVFLGRNYLDPTIEMGLAKDGIVTEAMQRSLHNVIFALIEEIKDSSTPFRPAADLKKQCPGCPYQTNCGTLWAKQGRW